MKKNIFFIVIAVLCLVVGVFAFSSCSGKKQEAKTYTYDDLSSDQKMIIDRIIEQGKLWETCQSSGKEYDCTSFRFSKENDNLIFAIYYETSPSVQTSKGMSSSTHPIFKVFQVDPESGTLSGRKYTISEGTEQRAATAGATTGPKIPSDSSISEKKDILANALYKLYENK